MPEKFKTEPEKGKPSNFTFEKEPSGEGFIYHFYFATQEEAEKAIRDFWSAYEGGEGMVEGLESGMLDPWKHEINCGDKTLAGKSSAEKDSERPFKVLFIGNTRALSPRGEAALRKIGFIE